MIDEDVKKIADGFAGYWNGLFGDSPRYQLDFTWPSLGIVNGILANLLGKRELTNFEKAQLHGASAYLGSIAATCWESFAGEPKVSLSFSKGGDCIIKASGGKHLAERETFEVNISEALAGIFAAPANPFPCFEKYSRPLPPNPNLVNLFALGLVTGLTPYGTGRWKDLSVTDLAAHIDAANIMLAESCAEYYKRVFPSEPLGTRTELYRSCLIFPPLGFKEAGYATRAVHGLMTCLKGWQTGEAESAALALNLASFPDEIISSAGFAVAAALCSGEPSPELRLIAEQLGHFKMLLRPALFIARDMHDETKLPALLIEDEQYVKAEQLLRVEEKLGLLPLVKIDIGYLLRKDLLFVLHFLFRPQAARAREALAEYVKVHDSPALRLQLAYLALFNGDAPAAKDILVNIRAESLSDSKLRALDAELRGYVFLEERNHLQATHCFREALAEKGLSPETRELLSNYLAESLTALGEKEKVRELYAEYGEEKNYSLRTFANRLPFLEDEHDFRTAVDALRRLVPHEPRLFQLYLREKLRERV